MNWRIKTGLRLLGMPQRKNKTVTRMNGTSCPAGNRWEVVRSAVREAKACGSAALDVAHSSLLGFIHSLFPMHSRTENRFHRRIKPPEGFIAVIHSRNVCTIGLDTRRNSNDRAAGCVYRRPNLRSYSSENSGAIRRAFLRLDDLNFMPVHIRLNLSPQGRSRPAAAQQNVFHRHVHFAENRERVPQTESHSLENRANHMSPLMRSGQTRQNAPRFRIQMRCALTH